MKRIIAWACTMLLWMGTVSAQAGEPYVALLDVEGEISSYSYFYDHAATVEGIEALIEDKDNAGIYIYIDSPGGGIYESDELYAKLMRYKKKTGRGIYCYVGAQACSGGLYVAMAADRIAAGRMSEIGDVGVYLETISCEELYKKLGIEHNVLVTGENKLEGYPTLTEAQDEIIRGRLEESLQYFLEVIRLGRGMGEEAVQELRDGRIFTATQAKERGLVDTVMTRDEAEEAMFAEFFAQKMPIVPLQEAVGGDKTEADGRQDGGTLVPDIGEGTLFDWLMEKGARSGGRVMALRRH